MVQITLKQVAQEADVSVASASNVLNGRAHKVSSVTAERIRKVAQELGYSRNQNAAALKKGSSSIIWLLLPKTETDEESKLSNLQTHPFYADFLAGIEQGASASQLQFGFLRASSAQDLMPLLNGSKPQGVIVSGRFNTEVEAVIAEWSLKTLIVDTSDFFERYPPNPNLTRFNADDYQMGYIGLKHLIDLGHREIVLLFGNRQDSVVHQQRYEGVLAAANECSEAINLHLLETHDLFRGSKKLFGKINQHLQCGATAVLAMADTLAIDCYREATQQNLAIPRDFSLVGMDCLSLLEYLPYQLNTVSQHIVQRGYRAVMHFVASDAGTLPIQSPPSLVLGDTAASR